MCTSEPTSDSSDTGGSGKSNDDPNSVNKDWDASSQMNNTSDNGHAPFPSPVEKESDSDEKNNSLERRNDIVQSDNVRCIFHFSGIDNFIQYYIGNVFILNCFLNRG